MSEIPYSVRSSRGGGATTLEGLTDTNISNPQGSQILVYDDASSKWINSAGGGGGATTLEALTDTNISNKQDNQIIKYNNQSGKWINSLPDPATSVNLGTTGTIITNLTAGSQNSLLASRGANAAPVWVDNISITSVQYPSNTATTTSSADASNPADVFLNPSLATGGKFEIFTKIVGDSLPTQKFTINHKGAVGIGNSIPVLNPADFSQIGTRPSYGGWGSILQSRGIDNEPTWLQKGAAGQVLTVASGSNNDLIWTTPAGGGATEYIYLQKTATNQTLTNAYHVVGDYINPLTTISENQTWFGGFASNGSFTFNTAGVYRIRTEILVVKTSSIPSGNGFWIGINGNSTTTNTADLIKLHYVNFRTSQSPNTCVLGSYTIPMEHILVATANIPYLIYIYGGGSDFFVQGNAPPIATSTIYIQKIA